MRGDRAALCVLGLVSALLVAGAFAVRIPQFWADGATYHAMAWSLAEDGDLEYEARDVFRVRREFPTGPQGIFLKRAAGGWALDPAGRPYLKVRVSAPPSEGAANAAVLAFLAKSLKRPKSALRIAAGETARLKIIEIDGIGEAEVAAAFGARA